MGTPGLTAYCTYPRLARRLPGLADVPEGYICGSVQQRLGLCSRASEGPLASFYEPSTFKVLCAWLPAVLQ